MALAMSWEGWGFRMDAKEREAVQDRINSYEKISAEIEKIRDITVFSTPGTTSIGITVGGAEYNISRLMHGKQLVKKINDLLEEELRYLESMREEV